MDNKELAKRLALQYLAAKPDANSMNAADYYKEFKNSYSQFCKLLSSDPLDSWNLQTLIE